jgi:hypothetical protein
MTEYKYPEYNEQGKIICQLCGKPFSMVTPSHLQRKHNATIDEYRNKFPDIALTSKQFNTSRKYETSDMFSPKKSAIETPIDIDEPAIETPINIEEPDADPIFEDLEKQTPVNPKIEKPDNISLNRLRILNDIQKYYKHTQQNYLIQNVSKNGRLEYEFITDYADPVLKVIVNFPKTFWHNNDSYQDPNKNIKLMQDGWKIIEIHSNAASTKDIDKAMKK